MYTCVPLTVFNGSNIHPRNGRALYPIRRRRYTAAASFLFFYTRTRLLNGSFVRLYTHTHTKTRRVHLFDLAYDYYYYYIPLAGVFIDEKKNNKRRPNGYQITITTLASMGQKKTRLPFLNGRGARRRFVFSRRFLWEFSHTDANRFLLTLRAGFSRFYYYHYYFFFTRVLTVW